MEREQFVRAANTASWGLLERDLDYRFEDLRRRLGAVLWLDRPDVVHGPVNCVPDELSSIARGPGPQPRRGEGHGS